jgi:hypothetical protein
MLLFSEIKYSSWLLGILMFVEKYGSKFELSSIFAPSKINVFVTLPLGDKILEVDHLSSKLWGF